MTTQFGKKVHLMELTQITLIMQVLVTSSPQDYVTNYKHDIFTSRVPMTTKLGRIKLLYLHYHNIYGHKTWQDGDFP